MKKIIDLSAWDSHALKKTLKIMRITLFLLFVGVIQMFATSTYSQATKVNIDLQNTSVEKVLTTIESQSEFYFLYNEKLIDVKRKVSVSEKNQPINKVLAKLFKGTGIDFQVIDRKIILAPVSLSTQQQTISISGIVKDETNEPIPGVSVFLKNTTIGTITDINGKYNLDNIPEDGILVYSFVGMTTKEIKVNGQKEINIILKNDAIGLEEVVAVGYGTQKKSDLTGAVSTIKQDAFNKGVVASPEQLLQGKVAGVNITSTSGEPGAAQSISIRGPGSIRSGNGPLYVVDGIPLSNDAVSPSGADMGYGTQSSKNPMDFINPDDIASIDVLKDASAAAIYGARGSNGVIIITTKSGKEGKSKIDYSSQLSVSKIAHKIGLLSTKEFTEKQTEYGNTDYIGNYDTDWQDQIYRTSISQNHNISISNGTSKSNYYASFGYFDQEGIVKESSMKRLNARINATQKMWDDVLTIKANLTGSVIKDNAAPIGNDPDATGDLITSALTMNPTLPAYDEDGDIYDNASYVNPLALLDIYTDYTKTIRIIGNLSADLKLTKNLHYKINLGGDVSTATRNTQISPYSYQALTSYTNGRVYISSLENENTLIDNLLTYNFKLQQNDFKLMAGHSYQKYYTRSYGFGSSDFSTNEISAIYDPGIGSTVSDSDGDWPTGSAETNELQSFFGRLNYAYAGKYLMTATLRVDGSSRFGDNNKYGTFPSVSGAWRISEESFMSNADFIHNLKLRAGWGETGNQEVPSKQTLASVTSDTSSGTGYALDGTTSDAGVSYVRNANPDLKWEVVTQTNLGLDFGFFDGKISGTIDYFNKATTDALLEVTVTDPLETAGGSSTWTNLSDTKIINKGWEFSLTYENKIGKLNYSIGANASLLQNTIKNLDGIYYTGGLSGSGLSNYYVQAFQNNTSVGAFYIPKFIGLDSDGLSLYQAADGSEIHGDDVTTEDYVVTDSALPDVTYSFFVSLDYKNFDFALNFNGVEGNKIYNNTANALFKTTLLDGGNNVSKKLIEDYPNESTSNTDIPSTRYLENGSFLRLNNATLGYTIKNFKTKYISNARIFVTGQNLFCVTNYSGYDPEVNTNKNLSNRTSYGIDMSSYPKARTFVFGVNVSF